MNKTILYTDAPKSIARSLMEGEIVADFLPPPEKLVRKEPKIKVTITLSSNSVNFFKRYAQKHKVKYQTMINELLDRYVQRYEDVQR